MDLNKLTKVTRYEITDNGFIFYDEQGNVPDPNDTYWSHHLNVWEYTGKSLKGLLRIIYGNLWLNSYIGESLEGLPEKVVILNINSYQGDDWENLPERYSSVFIHYEWYTKAEFDDFIKTEKLKKVLLD